MLWAGGLSVTSWRMSFPFHPLLQPTISAQSFLLENVRITLCLISSVSCHTGRLNWGRKLNGFNTTSLPKRLGHSMDDTGCVGRAVLGKSSLS